MSKINFISQWRAYRQRLKVKPVSAQAIALYDALLELWNDSFFWENELRPNPLWLAAQSGLSNAALVKARKELAEQGYITYSCTATKLGCAYLMIKLYEDKEESQEEMQNNAQNNSQSIDKLTRNEQEMNKKCNKKRTRNDTRNPIDSNYNNNIYIKQDKMRENMRENETAQAPTAFSHSEKLYTQKNLELFKENFPDKVNPNENYYIPPDLDMHELINQINKSEFLKKLKTFNLNWLLSKYEGKKYPGEYNWQNVLNGYYVTFDSPPPNGLANVQKIPQYAAQRTYTKEELDRLIDDISQVEF